MIGLSKLRSVLGKVKCAIFDQWWYRGKVKSIPKIREQYCQLIDELPPLPTFRENFFEIHMLCGHRDTDMGIWASWSIMRFLDGQSRLFVHSDGSLTADDVERWRKVVNEVIVIDRKESDVIIEQYLADKTTHLYPWRCSNWASAQLVDVHFFGDAPSLLILDSDVLTFSKPFEVIEALKARPPKFKWCKDLRNAYLASPAELKDIIGIEIPQRLCAGFLVCPRLCVEDFIILDEQMDKIAKDQRTQVGHFWSCQTYYALIASRYNGSGCFSEFYSNTDGKTSINQVLRHYVGIPKVRFRYYAEGLARVTKGLFS